MEAERIKTVKESLESLPEPYRSQAIENTSDLHLKLNSHVNGNLSTNLKGAFDWELSPQGFGYWDNFCETLLQQEKDPYKRIMDMADKLVSETQKVTAELFNKIRECEELKKVLVDTQDNQANLQLEIKLLRGIIQVDKEQKEQAA